MGGVLNRTYRRAAALVAALMLLGGGAGWSPLAPAAASQALPTTAVETNAGRGYDAYVPAATKAGQFDQYTCEFDAAWVIFETFGLDVSLDEQVEIIGVDRRVDPYYVETPDGVVVYGGDTTRFYSGDYTESFLARTTGQAMRKVFDAFGLDVEPVDDRTGLEAALDAGALVWIKATVDFLPWQPVTWITPEGEELPGVLGNDHAVVVMGYDEDVVVIRDVLGPTSSNWDRVDEYEVPWEIFLPVWEAQGNDGLAVSPPDGATSDESGVEIAPPEMTGGT